MKLRARVALATDGANRAGPGDGVDRAIEVGGRTTRVGGRDPAVRGPAPPEPGGLGRGVGSPGAA
jgi:hypothetical protein